MPQRLLFFSVIILLFYACKPQAKSVEEPAVPDTTIIDSATSPAMEEKLPELFISFSQGQAWFRDRDSEEWKAIEAGMQLQEGWAVKTEEAASVELSIGSFAVLRMLAESELLIKKFQPGKENLLKPQGTELNLRYGSLFSKVQKLSQWGAFIITTPNSAAAVRGTAFHLSYSASPSGSEVTQVSVREGLVAMLPNSALLTDLLDGRDEDPVASLVVSAAFSLAPAARAGEELSIGDPDPKAVGEADLAYEAMTGAAEGLIADGTELEGLGSEELASFLVPPASKSEEVFRSLHRRFPSIKLSQENQQLLEYLDRLREPGRETSILPAALPTEFFRTPDKETPAPPKTYPGLLWTYDLGSLVEAITRSGSTILALDEAGWVYGIDDQGQLLWSAGEGILNMTALDTLVSLTRETSLQLVQALDGTELSGLSFEGWAALPQHKAIPVPEGLALATPRGVMILRQENAQVLREIDIPSGIAAPLVLAERTLVGITGSGSLVLIDIAAGIISVELKAALDGKVYTPRYKNGRIFGINAMGRIVAVDLESAELVWDRDLGVSIKAEPELDDSTLFLWTGDEQLLRLSVSDGSDMGAPISGVQSPPLLSNGNLFWGGLDATLVKADAATGRIISRIPIQEALSVRPLMVDGALYVGTSKGRLLKVDSAAL